MYSIAIPVTVKTVAITLPMVWDAAFPCNPGPIWPPIITPGIVYTTRCHIPPYDTSAVTCVNEAVLGARVNAGNIRQYGVKSMIFIISVMISTVLG